MGAIFSTPAPPPTPVPTPQLSTPNDAADDERRARIVELLRRRRGRFGLIQTSPRGVVGPASRAPRRKSLLGE